MKSLFWQLGLLTTFLSVAHAADSAQTYDQLHPYYAEFCAVTQLNPLSEGRGGIGGHGVLFLKGACRDTSAGYPRLKVCAPGSIDLSSADAGVSISVDKMFENVNWMAMDGKSFLINGRVKPDQPVDQPAVDKVVSEVLKKGLLDGVSVHETYLTTKPSAMPTDEYIAREAISTDFAMNFGRNVYCVKLPIKQEMLSPMVDYLNSRNDEYRGSKKYNWSGIYNNCTHTTHNALAAAGIFHALATDKPVPVQLFNLAIPSNNFIRIARLGNDDSLNDIVRFYRDRYKRQMLMEHDWIGTQPGVLIENTAAHGFENSLYDTNSKFLILDFPALQIQHHRFKQINTDPRYSDTRANLEYFKKKYEKALASKRSIAQLEDANPDESSIDFESPEFTAFYVKYYAHIEQELSLVKKQLAALM